MLLEKAAKMMYVRKTGTFYIDEIDSCSSLLPLRIEHTYMLREKQVKGRKQNDKKEREKNESKRGEGFNFSRT